MGSGNVDPRDPAIHRAERAAVAAGRPSNLFQNFGNYHCGLNGYMAEGSSRKQKEACAEILRDPEVCWGFILSVKTSPTSWTFDESSFRPCCGADVIEPVPK